MWPFSKKKSEPIQVSIPDPPKPVYVPRCEICTCILSRGHYQNCSAMTKEENEKLKEIESRVRDQAIDYARKQKGSSSNKKEEASDDLLAGDPAFFVERIASDPVRVAHRVVTKVATGGAMSGVNSVARKVLGTSLW